MPLAINTLEQEFPLILYTYQFMNAADISEGCETFYNTTFGLDNDTANKLCGDNV